MLANNRSLVLQGHQGEVPSCVEDMRALRAGAYLGAVQLLLITTTIMAGYCAKHRIVARRHAFAELFCAKKRKWDWSQ